VTGFTTPANNGLKKIVTKAAGEITVSGGTLVDEEAGDSVTIKQFGYINEGTTLTSYNIEKTYADLTTDLALLVGMAPSGMGLTIPQDGVVTVNFDFMGVSEDSITASNGNGYNEATTTPIFTARDLAAALEDQESMGIVDLSFKLNNNLRTRLECGSAGVASLGSGNVELTGTLTAYYKSKTLYDKFVDETATSIAAHLADTAGNRYVFEFPQVKLTGGQRVAGGPNADVMAEMQWEAEMDSAEGVMMRIARLAA